MSARGDTGRLGVLVVDASDAPRVLTALELYDRARPDRSSRAPQAGAASTRPRAGRGGCRGVVGDRERVLQARRGHMPELARRSTVSARRNRVPYVGE
ncbi:hypothetical protein H0B56_01040 [Haloechinothrix sp. YIM 98757]|uniref:Uncharacterized protein n=1 Tax=Haloechinothrix aidingensis TaxID=2752311 RepID=A0A837ZZ76_9PSEU|nr:hypothetical protein [Haloechinothrix aidingensis]MBA0124123.1 hypothetical protein [Haloechinothrix aidingensis]